ncbi:hypothetical protein [Nocardia sp. NPDC050406]|uniref:hypothetical protein n=1 Tax=Nocardia sp. NPDC050406 TaxID=3364318 RepID=UPI0037AA4396
MRTIRKYLLGVLAAAALGLAGLSAPLASADPVPSSESTGPGEAGDKSEQEAGDKPQQEQGDKALPRTQTCLPFLPCF